VKIISVFNQKGGVGKTTTNINLCAYLAMQGYKVLAIDIDPQGNTTSGLGFDKRSLEKSTYNLFTEDIDASDLVKKCELMDNLYLIPSTQELAGAEIELIENDGKNKQTILKEKLKRFKDEFDFVFIDCPPSLGLLTINALTSSDSVFIPIQCEFYALEGVS